MKATRMAGVLLASGAIVAVGVAAAPAHVVAEPEIDPDDPCAAAPAGEASAEEVAPGPGPNATEAIVDCGEPFDGPPVSNLRGTYQARIIVLDGEVIDVVALQAGSTAPESVSVNTKAIPAFRERVLAAQSWDVDAVSGASYTSPAFTESLHGAFEAAGLE